VGGRQVYLRHDRSVVNPGLGSRAQGPGLRVQGVPGFRVQGLGFRIQGLWPRV